MQWEKLDWILGPEGSWQSWQSHLPKRFMGRRAGRGESRWSEQQAGREGEGRKEMMVKMRRQGDG